LFKQRFIPTPLWVQFSRVCDIHAAKYKFRAAFGNETFALDFNETLFTGELFSIEGLRVRNIPPFIGRLLRAGKAAIVPGCLCGSTWCGATGSELAGNQ